MWVFDGEEWTDEGNGESVRKPEPPAPELQQQVYPELQVIEHLPPTRNSHVPPLPLP